MSGTIGWTTIADADAYVAGIIDPAAWDALDDADKERYLTTSYRTLSNDPNYSFPSTATTRMENAQIEYALYLLSDPNAIKRQSLIDQGVESFKILNFQETYRDPSKAPMASKYPAVVLDLLSIYKAISYAFGTWERVNPDLTDSET